MPRSQNSKDVETLGNPARNAAAEETESPPALHVKVTRWLLLAFAVTLPIYYDLGVPEVSGDVRWMATSFFAGLALLVMLAGQWRQGGARAHFKWPVMVWLALGLCAWAALSMVDALNWMRGIILWKAMVAQVTLMALVYAVATPKFVRQLMWALVLPLAFTSFLGICQFKGWNGAVVSQLLDGSLLFFWVKPVFWLLGYVVHALGFWIERWPQSYNFVDQLVGYFQQSAVPGSTFANKNLAGSWTAMMLPMTLYLLVTSKRWPGQALASVLLAMGGLFLIYARARASWVALFAALMTMGALMVLVPAWRQAIWRHMDWKHILWLMLPLAVVAKWGGDISPVEGAYAVDRSPAQQVEALAGSSWNEIGGRLAYNLNSLVITKDYWFDGVGLGSFFVIYPAYYNALVVTPTNSYNVNARPQRTHTDLMQAFDEMGIPGGLLYAGMFIAAIAMAFRLAGPRAGALGGKMVAAGMASAVMALMIFLEQQEMLALPAPWGSLTQLLMAVGILALLVWGYYDARAVQHEKEPADDTQLLGLMAGIGVLTICINALMDFPMQLPTAPAAAMLLMGAIAGIYVTYRPQTLAGPRRVLAMGRPALLGVIVLAGSVWVAFLWDAWLFREGNVLLKQGMVRIFSGMNDEQTIALLEEAKRIYPLDPRIHEHLGVAYANYNGATQIPVEARIEKVEGVLKGDGWAANQIINLSGLYLQLAENAQQKGDGQTALAYLARVEQLYAKLQRVADFSHYTWGIGGMLRLMEGRNDEAASLFRRALTIEPNYPPAVNGLRIATERMTVKPLQVRDGITGQ
ncbi:MAG: hypothetical protein GC129_07365 [Proteobacteria bacterium]|nr:hypothetical protein [Pseudomonadota bacterium]